MMTRLISLFLLIMMSTTSLAQDAQIVDSLTQLLTKKVGADRYEPLYELAFEYIDRDNLKAHKNVIVVITSAGQFPPKKRVMQALIQLRAVEIN